MKERDRDLKSCYEPMRAAYKGIKTTCSTSFDSSREGRAGCSFAFPADRPPVLRIS